MSKYIIDTETWANLFEVKSVGVYGIGNDIATDEKTVWSRMFRLDELEELNSDYINEHFGSLQDEAYQAGLEDAWEATKRIFGYEIDGGIPINKVREVFGIAENAIFCTADIIRDYTAQEAIAKLKAYDNATHSDRIEVGDIVDRYIDGKFDNRGIYLGGNGEIWDCLFWANALPITLAYPKEQFKKTGKHYDIASILEAMRK